MHACMISVVSCAQYMFDFCNPCTHARSPHEEGVFLLDEAGVFSKDGLCALLEIYGARQMHSLN